MENLNAEQVKKALECCLTTSESDCIACAYRGKKDGLFITCTNCLMADALALITSQEQRIKELTEENERLNAYIHRCKSGEEYWVKCLIERADEADRYKRYYFNHEYDKFEAEVRADTVRKMQEMIKARFTLHSTSLGLVVLVSDIDQIAKEMLEGE